MKSNEHHASQRTAGKKRKILFCFLFGMIILFLLSFSATTYILMNSYRLTFVGEDFATLQQEIGLLKNEVARKNSEIEELKLQIANMEGESSFVNQFQSSAKGFSK